MRGLEDTQHLALGPGGHSEGGIRGTSNAAHEDVDHRDSSWIYLNEME